MDATVGDRLEDLVRAAVRAETSERFEELRRFVDRRISELSMEVSATEQLVDYSESNLSGQLKRIADEVARMVALPAAATRNSGIELEAVVEATEQAANKIMEACEGIGTVLRAGTQDAALIAAIDAKIGAIFEACTFQDLTSQRIRRAIAHLAQVESTLTNMVGASAETPTVMAAEAAAHPDLMQDDIDRLMSGR